MKVLPETVLITYLCIKRHVRFYSPLSQDISKAFLSDFGVRSMGGQRWGFVREE